MIDIFKGLYNCQLRLNYLLPLNDCYETSYLAGHIYTNWKQGSQSQSCIDQPY